MSAPARGGGPAGRGGFSSRGGRNQPNIGPDGKEINPYIPRFISNAPWYLEKSDDYLQHQRSTKEDIKGEWYDRGGDNSSTAPIKFRKGACKNCGAMTHQAKDCMERPRKVGAKYSGLDLRADEHVQNIRTTWDSKRDRWNGYDAEEYKRVVDDYEQEEQIRAEANEEERLANIREGKESGEALSPGGESAKTKEDADKMSTRTLRVREDKASYLTDLSEDSALFNPKSRTLRSEVDGSINDRGQFVRKLTDLAEDHDELRRLADIAAEQGEEINLESNPTEAILRLRQIQQKESEAAKILKDNLLSKYGGEEYLTKRPRELEEAPLEEYTEYTADGEVKKRKTDDGEAEAKEEPEPEPEFAKSKYDEDVFPGNHSSVWGSYWKEGKWGFECCHSLVKQSYCLHYKGQEINGMEKNSMFTG